MKVCQVSHLYYPDGAGDAFGLHEFDIRMHKKGVDIEVLTWGSNRDSVSSEILDGIKVTRLRGINFALLPTIKEYPYLISFKNFLGKLSPDIISAHSHLFLPTLQAVSGGRKFGIPTVVTIRGLSARRGWITDTAQLMYLLSVCRHALSEADCVICLSEYEREAARRLGLGKRVELIPNGVDTTLFQPGQKDPYQITWVGRMVPEKGLKYLMKAMSQVTKEFPQAKLSLVGDGPLSPQIKASAKSLALDSNCIFWGKMNRTEVAEILAKSSIFVFPSLSEGMPKAVLEAMACGNAIVASDIPFTRDLIENGKEGLLVSPRDSVGLANGITSCLDDKNLRRDLQDCARAKVMQNYDGALVIERHYALFQELAGRK